MASLWCLGLLQHDFDVLKLGTGFGAFHCVFSIGLNLVLTCVLGVLVLFAGFFVGFLFVEALSFVLGLWIYDAECVFLTCLIVVGLYFEVEC